MKKNRGKPDNRKHGPKQRVSPRNDATVYAFSTSRELRFGELGVFDRSYPPKRDREHAIERIRAMPEHQRSPDQWWMLGEYLVYGGLLDESDSVVNDGIAALMRGASLPEPSVASVLDLAWILAFKGLDTMALPYIDRAASLVPNSRDIMSLKALIHLGLGDKSAAISAYEAAVALPNATDTDREALAKLRAGEEPRALRKSMLFRKIGFGDPDLAMHPTGEQALALVHVAKQIYDQDPTDHKAAERLAFWRYCAGQLDRAKPLALSVVGANPQNAQMWAILGLIEKKAGNRDGEMEMYRKAVNADPDHVLALVNLASRLQDNDPHAARPLLERVLQIAEPDNPYLHVALDLMGNNIAMIEGDHIQEAEFHRQAIKLAPDAALPRANLVFALLAAGRFSDARREWQTAKHLISKIEYPFPLGQLVQAF